MVDVEVDISRAQNPTTAVVGPRNGLLSDLRDQCGFLSVRPVREEWRRGELYVTNRFP